MDKTSSKTMKQLIWIFLALALFSCDTEETKITKGKYTEQLVNVYSEIIHLQEEKILQQDVYRDSVKSILKKHGLNQEEFSFALASFRKNPEQWRTFYSHVLDTLEKSHSSQDKKKFPQGQQK